MSFPTYHKIQSVFKRDPETKFKTFLPEYSRPEFEYLRDLDWEWTEKVDGTNIRVHWNGDRIHIGGRTDNAQLPADLISNITEMFPFDNLLELFGSDGGITLFGEGYGAGVQRGGGYRKDKGFILFDVLAGENLWLAREDVDDIAEKLEIHSVPVVEQGTLDSAIHRVQHSAMNSLLLGATCRSEGFVLRPKVEMLDRFGKRIITKLKVKDFAGDDDE
jgi:hypothetical protein